MKTDNIKIPFLILSLAAMFNGVAQNDTKTQHPFQIIDKDIEVLTLSNGKYNEFFDTDSIEIIGDALFNVNTKKVIGFVEYDTAYSEATMLPEITSRWLSPDPEARAYPEVSPYNFVVNSPIQFIDPAGTVVVDPKTGEQVVKVNGEWKTASGGDVSKKFIKDSQPVLDKLTASAVGTKIYDQLQSIRTKVKIDLSDKPNLQALKNGGNSKVRTPDGQFNNIGSDGLYDEVIITPTLEGIEASSKANGIDFEEKLLQTMSVEKDHIATKEQIAKEKGYDHTFNTPEKFGDVYNDLLNNAIKVGKDYRNETGKPIDKTSNQPITNVKKHPSGIGSKLKVD